MHCLLSFFGKLRIRDDTEISPHQRAPASDHAIIKYASAHARRYVHMRLTAWPASFHTNRAVDILSRRLSHRPRPRLTSRRSGLSHQPQVDQCSLNWSYSRGHSPCFLNPAAVTAPSCKAVPRRNDRRPRVPAAMPLRVPITSKPVISRSSPPAVVPLDRFQAPDAFVILPIDANFTRKRLIFPRLSWP